MAKINNTAAYALSTPIVGDDIVIGSAGGAGGDTKNFQMSDILTYIMTSSTLTLQDVCDNGTTTSTGITVGGAVTMSAGATINGSGLAVNGSGGILVTDVAGITSAGGPVSGTALSTSGGLFVSGTSILGEIDSAGPADIADTLTLSLASGTGLQVDADANIDGNLTVAGGIFCSSLTGISTSGPATAVGLFSSDGLFISSGTATFNGAIDANSTVDIADTLTLSLASGTGLQVDADANIDGNLTITLGSALYTSEIRTTNPLSNLAFYTGGFLRGSFTALGTLVLNGGLNVQNGGALMNQGLAVNNFAQFNDEFLLGGSVPSSSTDTGLAGQIAVDATYIYVCVGTNSWGRVAIDTTPF